MNRKSIIVVFCTLALIITYLVVDHLDGLKDKRRRQIFSKVSKGMKKEQVVSILGKPDTIFYSNDSSTTQFEYFTKEYEGSLKSGTPTVVFDSLGKLLYTSYGD